MTREEQIREASIDYQLSTDPRAIGGDAFADMAREMNVNQSFIEGARWSDNNIPEIGKEYHFFDDGKKSTSRHYICKCERVITPEEAKGIIFDLDDGKITLYDIWKDESSKCDFLFAKNTDYFVEVSCPKYDKNNLWAVRTKGGGWFTLDVQNDWQGGRIDVTGEIFDNVVKFWTKEGEMGKVDGYLEETYNQTKTE